MYIKDKPVFPKPQKCSMKVGFAVIGKKGLSRCCLVLSMDAMDLEKEGFYLLSKKIGGKTGVTPKILLEGEVYSEGLYPIKVNIKSNNMNGINSTSKEAYMIDINDRETIIYAAEVEGLFYGIQTLIQLLDWDGCSLILPLCEIEDWPDMKYRGLFIEDKWGTDRMTLEDWKDLIDYMASLKLNFLNVGVYGCWIIQYDNKITEFSFLPLSKCPDLKTPKVIRYYSPVKDEWVILDYLPDMFKEDFFGELISYGKKRNVLVNPMFNSLGHNTMLPRLYPDTSARDADGKATGYSFCTSNNKTYEVLFDIYDEVIDKYLKPNGIDWFAIGLDEVWKTIGIDPKDPFKEFDPWCKCLECSRHSHEELFISYIVKLARYLKNKGMKNICMFYDQLNTMELINEKLVKRLKDEGLFESIVIDWWNYNTDIFKTTNPELGCRRFVMPMTGYYAWMLTDSYLANIYNMLKLGHEEGAEGTKAYCVFDYSYDRNYHCLSEYAWNNTNTCSLGDFRQRYIHKYFKKDGGDKADEAFGWFDKLTEPSSEIHDMAFYLLNYYIYTYTKNDKEYPRNFPGEIFATLLDVTQNKKLLLDELLEAGTKAYKLFDELLENMDISYSAIIEHYKVECWHYRVLANEFLRLIELAERYSSPEFLLKSREEKLATLMEFKEIILPLKQERERLMLSIEKVKKHYWIPSLLRNMSIYREYLSDIKLFIDRVYTDICDETEKELPVLDLKDTRNIEGRMFRLLR